MNSVEAMHIIEKKIDYVIYSLKEREEISRDIGLTLSFDREILCLERARDTLEQGLRDENERNSKILSDTCTGIDWASNMIKQLKE